MNDAPPRREIAVAEDAFAARDWPLFDPERAARRFGTVPRVRIVSLLSRVARGESVRIDDLIEDCCAHAVAYLGLGARAADRERRLWAYAATPVWEAETRVLAYKGLWRRIDAAGTAIDPSRRSEYAERVGGRVRFHGCAEIDPGNLLAVVRALSGYPAFFLVGDREREFRAETFPEFARAGFGPATGADTPGFVVAAVLDGWGVLRVGYAQEMLAAVADYFS